MLSIFFLLSVLFFLVFCVAFVIVAFVIAFIITSTHFTNNILKTNVSVENHYFYCIIIVNWIKNSEN